jgi:RND family efflux transporter MFP subunit
MNRSLNNPRQMYAAKVAAATASAAFALAIIACSLIGCTHATETPPIASQQADPVEVRAVRIQGTRWDSQYDAIGSVKAYTISNISSKVAAYVIEVPVKVGDVVREGQRLVTLDSRELDASYKSAQSHRAEIEDAIAEAQQGLVSAEAQLTVGRVTYTRMSELHERKTISQQEFDECTARWTQAQAGHAMAEDKIKQMKSRLEQVDQELKTAEVNRGYATLNAPFSGVVTAKPVEPGILAAPGMTLITLEKTDRYRLEVTVEENRLPAIRLGQTIPVSIEATGFSGSVRVSEIAPAVDPGTRAGIVKLDLPNDSKWRSGQFGRAHFAGSPEDVLTVPADAVKQEGQINSVQVADDSTLRVRLVTVGRSVGKDVEVFSGLRAGETVLAPFRRELADGAKVRARL